MNAEENTVRERAPIQAVEGPLAIGELVGGAYQILAVLGRGGMGVVYEAEDCILGRRVALKTALVADQRGALHREGRALAVVRSPGLPVVYAAGVHRGHPFLVMERLNGRSLEQRMDDTFGAGHRFEIAEVVDTLSRIADALSAAHAAGVAHRDLKPGNLMVCGSRLVLVDFGLFVPECHVLDESRVGGSIHYMAPEVLTRTVRPGEGPAIDLYALGVVAYELLTGQVPYDAKTASKIALAHVNARVPDVRELRSDTPPALAELVTSLLQKRPEDRPEGAEAVFHRLAALHGDPTRAGARPLRMVLVDDDEDILRILARSLRAVIPGVEVDVYSDPREALARVDARSADVVLLDLDMPYMTGVELTMALASLPASRRPRVIALSADADARDVTILRSLGVWDFIPKDARFVSAALRSIGELRRAMT